MKRVLLHRALSTNFVLALASIISADATVIETTSPICVGTLTSIQGNGGTGYRMNAFSQRMVQPVQYAGKVTSCFHSSLTDSSATWVTAQFGTNGVPAYVEFDNGWTVDIADTSASTRTLLLAGSLDGIANVGDPYRVRPHTTVAGLFGPNDESGLKNGLNPAQADNIVLAVSQTQQSLIIFYFSNAIGKGWFRADYTPAGNQIIYPEQGVLVRRIVPGDINLLALGVARTGVTVVPVEPGLNALGTLKSSKNLPLSALNLYTGDSTTGVSSGLNLTDSDRVVLLQPDGSTRSFFYFKNPSFAGWLDASFNSADSTLVNSGTCFFIQRKTTNGPFYWTMPAE